MTANPSLRKITKFGHLGLESGNKIITDPDMKAIEAIIYGNVFGPTGSAKNGDSSW